uniref:glutathione transferase n=1 Tax=Panonychus citri TaxID=50023 RepID=K9MXT7_PANCT|nr:glutathione S-transferase mu4 [Panonychus citri]
MTPIIGYWTYRANVEPILLTMRQINQPYQLKTYKQGDGSDYLGDEWPIDKKGLGLIYPNVPYYIEGDVKITQTLAILRYLARKHDFGSRTEEEYIRIDIVEQGAFEIMSSLWRAWYVDTQEECDKFNEQLIPFLEQKLEHTSQVLGSDEFILGDRVTFIDFLLYSTLDYVRLFRSQLFDCHENLTHFLNRIENLPNIKSYFTDENFKRFPIIGSRAKWGHNPPSN